MLILRSVDAQRIEFAFGNGTPQSLQKAAACGPGGASDGDPMTGLRQFVRPSFPFNCAQKFAAIFGCRGSRPDSSGHIIHNREGTCIKALAFATMAHRSVRPPRLFFAILVLARLGLANTDPYLRASKKTELTAIHSCSGWGVGRNRHKRRPDSRVPPFITARFASALHHTGILLVQSFRLN
jgi:hypothetical protein